jgi:HEAT repeats
LSDSLHWYAWGIASELRALHAGISPRGWATLPDPLQPTRDLPKSSATATDGAQLSATASHNSPQEAPQPSEVDVVHALAEVEQATKKSAAPEGLTPPDRAAPPQSGPSRTLGVILYLSVGFALIMLLGWTVQNGARRIHSSVSSITDWGNGAGVQSGATTGGTSSSQQAEAENLLGRLASGDSIAADQILSESDRWIGGTQRTAKANQFVNVALNQRDLHLRGAALQATLALDGVSRDADGLNRLELAAANRNTRAWALWMLGALGNRGVEQERVVQTLRRYLDDSDARTRSGAVYGLGLVATDETVPMLLERFRNDPSPGVQESAACSLAEAGMYTHEQRMVAAASLVGWLDDAGLSTPQKEWAAHALRDISGLNFGNDAWAWQQWYSGTR